MQGAGGYSSPLPGGVDASPAGEADGVGVADDKNPFTREERKQIRISINNAYDESRQNQERTIDILNERAFNNDEKAINELKVRRTLRDVIKVERPKNHYRTHSNC